MHEAHVLGHEADDMVAIGVGETQATAYGVGHLGADGVVLVKADAVLGVFDGWRFSDIVEQRAEGQRR